MDSSVMVVPRLHVSYIMSSCLVCVNSVVSIIMLIIHITITKY